MNTETASPPPRRRLIDWWWDLALPKKAMLVLVAPLVFVTGPIVAAVVLGRDQSHIRDEEGSVQALRDDLDALEVDVLQATSDAFTFTITGNAELLDAIDEFAATFPNRVTAIRARIDGEQSGIMDAIETDAGSLYSSFQGVRGLVINEETTGTDREAIVAAVETQRGLLDQIVAEFNDLDHMLLERQESLGDQVEWRGDQILINRVVGGAIGIVAGGIALLLFTRSIVKRIRLVGAVARRVMDGEGLGDLEPPAKDEIGTLISELQRAAGMLIEINAEIVQSRDSAIAATQEKDEFLSRMSHELRTPLSAILGFGQLLQMEELSDEDRDSVDHIVKAGRHLLALINDLLDISRIATGHLALSLESVDVADAVDGVVSLLRPQANEQGITVSSLVRPGVVVTADHQRVKQVLLNLVSNAIKYNSSAGTVQITTERLDDRVRVCVTDSGAGISRALQQRLFMPFERLDATSTTEGAGVGLALSKSLVEAMTGTIGLDSVVGRGSTFWIELPLAPLTTDGVADASIPDRPVTTSSTRVGAVDTVLYVEDNLANVRVMERFMQGRPEHLEVSMQGGIAISLARDLQPIVVLLDVHLPDMNGGDVLAALKADPLTSGIPVVVVSADATDGGVRRLLDLGADAYLAKPIDIAELASVLDEIRSRRVDRAGA